MSACRMTVHTDVYIYSSNVLGLVPCCCVVAAGQHFCFGHGPCAIMCVPGRYRSPAAHVLLAADSPPARACKRRDPPSRTTCYQEALGYCMLLFDYCVNPHTAEPQAGLYVCCHLPIGIDRATQRMCHTRVPRGGGPCTAPQCAPGSSLLFADALHTNRYCSLGVQAADGPWPRQFWGGRDAPCMAGAAHGRCRGVPWCAALHLGFRACAIAGKLSNHQEVRSFGFRACAAALGPGKPSDTINTCVSPVGELFPPGIGEG